MLGGHKDPSPYRAARIDPCELSSGFNLLKVLEAQDGELTDRIERMEWAQVYLYDTGHIA